MFWHHLSQDLLMSGLSRTTLKGHSPPGAPSDVPPLPPDREPPDIIILPPKTPPREEPEKMPPAVPPPPRPEKPRVPPLVAQCLL